MKNRLILILALIATSCGPIASSNVSSGSAAVDSFEQLIRHVFHFIFNRAPTSSEIQDYDAKLSSGALTEAAFRIQLARSPEGKVHINYRYQKFFARDADASELEIWRRNLSDPAEKYGLNEMVAIMVAGDEFRNHIYNAYYNLTKIRPTTVVFDKVFNYSKQYILSANGSLAKLRASALETYLRNTCEVGLINGPCTGSLLPAGKVWALARNDEFNGSALNETLWTPQTGNHNPTMVISRDTPANAVVDSGVLRLKTTYSNGWVTAAAISKFEQRYGYIEARLQINKARGNDSAFWMMAPGKFEIDVTETFFPSLILQNIYNHRPGQKHLSYQGHKITSANLSAGFHIYGVLWNRWGVKWYVDGVQTDSRPCDFCNLPVKVYLSSHTVNFNPWNYYPDPTPDPALNGTETAISWVRIYE